MRPQPATPSHQFYLTHINKYTGATCHRQVPTKTPPVVFLWVALGRVGCVGQLQGRFMAVLSQLPIQIPHLGVPGVLRCVWEYNSATSSELRNANPNYIGGISTFARQEGYA